MYDRKKYYWLFSLLFNQKIFNFRLQNIKVLCIPNEHLHVGVQSFDNQFGWHSHLPVSKLHIPLLLQCESYLQTNSENAE